MRVAIALGSNLPSRFGDPAANLRQALVQLAAFGDLLKVSSFYRTAPVGFTDQPDFLNAAVLLETTCGPLPLLRGLLRSEDSMGRHRNVDLPPKGPRTIDLDMLLYEDEQGNSLILQAPDLILPHPEMHTRKFVLEPLAEIAPLMMHPALHCTVAELLSQI